MTIQQFKEELNSRLEVLNEKERNEIISEYIDHIHLKIEDGKSEAEAIQDFGNLDDLCKEILDSYHVNTTYTKKNSTFENYISYFARWINNTAEKITKMNQKDLITLIIEVVVIIAILIVFSGFIQLLGNLFLSIFNFLPYFIRSPFRNIVHIIISVFNIVFIFYVLYIFFNKKFNKDKVVMKKEVGKAHVDSFTNTLSESIVSVSEDLSNLELPEKVKDLNIQIKLNTFFRFIGKFFAFFLFLPFFFLTLALIIGLGVLIALYTSQAMILGPIVIILGFMILSLTISTSLGSYIFSKGGRNNEKSMD